MDRVTDTIHRLVSEDVTHVVGIPDSTSGPLFHEVLRHPTIRLITASREGEAIAIAAGLWLGGAFPLVVIQNTGFLESGDALRGTAMRMAAAVPIVVTGRGYAKMAAAAVPADEITTLQNLTRVDVDSAALLTELTLRAWGVPFELCQGDDDPLDALSHTIRSARREGRPTALVLTRPLP